MRKAMAVIAWALCAAGCGAPLHGWSQATGCTQDNNSCSLQCATGQSCGGTCGTSCSASCAAGATCELTVGPSSSVSCTDATCHVTCTGSCSVSCGAGGTCDLVCPGQSSPVPIPTGGSCP